MSVKKKILLNFFLLFVSLVLVLIIGEITVRTLGITDKLMGYDSKLFVAEDNPSLGYGFRPNFHGFVAESEFKINSIGMRDYEYAEAKPEGVLRIAVLGDSVAAGLGVGMDETFPKQLEKLFREKGTKCEVMNFGVNGYNLSQEVASFKKKALRFYPDIAVLCFNINDIREAYTLNDNGLLDKKYDYSEYRFPWNLIFTVERALVRRSQFFLFLKRKTVDFLKSRQVGSNFLSFGEAQLELEKEYYIGNKSESWKKAKKDFLELKKITDNSNVKLIVVVLPFAHQLDAPEPDVEPQSTITAFLREEGFVYMDLRDMLKDKKDERLFRSGDYNHPNASGHKAIAEAVYERISG